MSTKAWKDREINTLLTESWGLKMDLEALAEESDVEETIEETTEVESATDTTETEISESNDEDVEKKADFTVDQIREAARRVLTRLKETKKNG
jgi:hypothetical protein